MERAGGGDSEAPVPPVAGAAAGDDGAPRRERMWQTLRRAMRRACPAELSGAREELVHEALLRVLEREAAASPVWSATYLWRVAFSVVADELRRRRRGTHGLDPAWDEGREPRPDLAIALRAALAELSEPRRLAVTLHLQGYSTSEASRLLGWDPRRVRNLVFRGMVDLRRLLGRGDDE